MIRFFTVVGAIKFRDFRGLRPKTRENPNFRFFFRPKHSNYLKTQKSESHPIHHKVLIDLMRSYGFESVLKDLTTYWCAPCYPVLCIAL